MRKWGLSSAAAFWDTCDQRLTSWCKATTPGVRKTGITLQVKNITQNHGFAANIAEQLGLPEPWFVITHTIWTTQEDTVFISDRDRNGGRCSVGRADVSRDSLIVSEKPERMWLTMRESLETSALPTEHRPPFLSLSLIKTVSSCVVQIVCVITNQGSGNPNCFELSKGCV